MNYNWPTTKIFRSWLLVLDPKSLKKIHKRVLKDFGLPEYVKPGKDRQVMINQILIDSPDKFWMEFEEPRKEIEAFSEAKKLLRNMSKSFKLTVNDDGQYYMWVRTAENVDLEQLQVMADQYLERSPPGYLEPGSPKVGDHVLNDREEIAWNILAKPATAMEVQDRWPTDVGDHMSFPVVTERGASTLLGRMVGKNVLEREKIKRVFVYRRKGGA